MLTRLQKTLLIGGLFIALNCAAQSTTVNYCIDPKWAPYESIVENQHKGISKIFVDLIAKKSGINFIFVPTNSWQQSLHFVKTGRCDLLPLLNSSPEREHYLAFSNDYFQAPNTIYAHYDKPIIGNLSGLTDQTIAVVADYRLHQHLKKYYPNSNIVAVKTAKIGLEKVNNGEVDYFVGSFHAANRIIQLHDYNELRISGITNLEDRLRIGITKNKAHLLPVFNQAIAQITPAERKEISIYLTSIKVKEPPNYTAAIQVGGILLVFILILFIRYLQLTRHGHVLAEKNKALEKLHLELDSKNKQLTELAMKDPLTSLFNRVYLSTIIDQQIRLAARYQTHVCMIMIDIDDFKAINDKSGHLIGDEVLKSIASVLTKVSRETDSIARWGGEEFVILCPETDINEAQLLAKRLQQTMVNISVEKITGITCSIAIAELAKNVTANDWFKQADQAMYHAKANGKNCIQLVK